ncbi:hypothetical protein EAH76_15940 [Sphingomonas glacialis]|uniref:Uncharacterized protein n=1 Tax=Sphingomonas glacialis TaxID=658225 RepID=A0A502FRP0_9SPHN|nr:hypothetical protein EAH76_15940 [Sphingomonas glacialis]
MAMLRMALTGEGNGESRTITTKPKASTDTMNICVVLKVRPNNTKQSAAAMKPRPIRHIADAAVFLLRNVKQVAP